MTKLHPLPPHVAGCLTALRRAGYEAYPVGGGVRDLLLGRPAQDWDVATAALPAQVLALFPSARPTGLAHGTVTLPTPEGPIEITTFRGEGDYRDGRHPRQVRFGVGLEDDLARRDFTINAMALAPDGSVIDPLGGRADLEAGVLRCVGQPRRRFAEDRLRMFRALRLAAQLGFALHPDTAAALDHPPSTAPLAVERVGSEVEQALCSPRPAWVGEMLRRGLLEPWLGPARGETAPLRALPPQPLARWSGLAALLGDGALPEKLRRPKALSGPVALGWQLLQAGLPQDPRAWRHTLARHGREACQAAGCMALALGQAAPAAQLEQVLAARPCLSVRELALSGGALAGLGLSGPEIGRAQARLLAHVLDRPEDNRPQALLALLEQW